ncbi:O-antigen ligase family protein [Clostridium estertheticum]|uniref:O-antigen ligase family protein n=1 Tax=Clostridium estertheticum TaxID=238834 RepID=UPI001C7CB4C1|nr:O-antigen ligase family protein [Clostridium estertheticum]MBX4258423.1 O-antigen ligase family protein [Clostridium estertheticum]WLC69622.1 O-antigen ligase family protein [Clostridium estertheticum]
MEKYYKRDEASHIMPIMLMIFIVPIIVRLRVIPLIGAQFDLWTGVNKVYDFFSYYKMIWILMCTVLVIIMFMVKVFQTKFKVFRKSYYFIPIAIYSVGIILSTMLSQYKGISVWGFIDRYEGMFVLLAYMITLSITILLVDCEYHIKLLFGALFASAIVIGVIGVFQYIGSDIFQSNFGKSMMLPAEYMKNADKIKFLNTGIYSTLYHYNYVGSYMAMMFPLTITLFLLVKNKIGKYFMGVLSLLMLLNLIASNSRAGIIGGILALVVLLIMMRKHIKLEKKHVIVGCFIFVLMFVGLNVVSKGALNARMGTLFSEVKLLVSPDNKKQSYENLIPLKDVKVQGATAHIVINDEVLNLEISGNSFVFSDKNKQPVKMEFISQSNSYTLKDERYKGYNIGLSYTNNKPVIHIFKGDVKLYFKLENNLISIVDYKGKDIDINNIPRWGFEGKELFASSRGYIWSRSLPLVKDTLLLGHGPDTFAAYFPQQDIKGKMYAYSGDMWQLVDKAHNLYLQIALNTGVLSLLAVLALFIMYIKKSCKIYYNSSFKDFNSVAGLGIFVAVVGYLGAALFNDSVVSVAPVFWILLGMGISINNILMPKKIKIAKK